MLKPLNLYVDKVKQKEVEHVWFNEHYQYLSGFQSLVQANSDNWNRFDFVSVDKDNNVIAVMCVEILRYNERAENFVLFSFANSFNEKLIVSKDLQLYLDKLFSLHYISKLNFTSFVQNPANVRYEKLVQKVGGRLVGTHYKHVKSDLGEWCDENIWEVTKENYLNWKNSKPAAK